MSGKTCSACRACADSDADFCPTCGISLVQAGPARQGTQKLACVIGRDASSAVRIDAPSVSSRHALLSVEDGALVIADMGSANGTFVRGERITRAPIWPGDRVLLGAEALPWNHPVVAALSSAISAPRPQWSPGGPAPQTTYRSSETPKIAFALSRPPRSVLMVAVGAGMLALGALVSVVVIAAIAAELTVPASAAPTTGWTAPTMGTSPVMLPAVDSSPYFTASDPPRSRELFARRLADQIDMDRQIARVREMRFKLSSGAVIPLLGADQPVTPRTSWAVPLGVVNHDGRQALAVATTRCIVDYRYPTGQARTDYANLAIFSGEGRSREVFRLGQPNFLPGVRNVYDQQRQALFFTSRYHLAGPPGDRYFGELAQHPEWLVAATLPVGDWQTQAGVDMAVLYFPVDDRGVGALTPRRNLGLTDPDGTLRQMLEGRTSLWGDTFTFDLVSRECMQAMRSDVQEGARGGGGGGQLMSILAGVAAIALFQPILLGPLLNSLGPAVLEFLVTGTSGLGSGQGGAFAGQLLSAVWRTLVRTDGGESFESAVWNEAGGLLLTFARRGGVERMALAGLSDAGLDSTTSARVVETVRSFLSRPGTGLTVMAQADDVGATCRGGGHCVASVQDAASQTDVSAEILRRGLARLDMSDEQLLVQQPGLIQAAREAFADPATRGSSAIANDDYQRQVNALAARLLR